jgi:transposase-like protein
MDNAARRFREAADRENRGRRRVRRRYSKALQAEAVRYCRTQARHGTGLREVAVTLGVAPWSLYRWMQRSAPVRSWLQRVDVVADAPVAAAPGVVVVVTQAGARVEGLDVQAAARLLTLLR